jgi:hypothetical protein
MMPIQRLPEKCLDHRLAAHVQLGEATQPTHGWCLRATF